MSIYIFAFVILLVGLLIIYFSKSDSVNDNRSVDSTGGGMIHDDFFDGFGDSDGGGDGGGD